MVSLSTFKCIFIPLTIRKNVCSKILIYLTKYAVQNIRKNHIVKYKTMVTTSQLKINKNHQKKRLLIL